MKLQLQGDSESRRAIRRASRPAERPPPYKASPPPFAGFQDGACDEVQAHLRRHIVGQELAVGQIASAVCDHLALTASLAAAAARPSSPASGPARPRDPVGTAAESSPSGIPQPRKPLVLSLHGPPGVGKSFAHHLLAQALFGVAPASFHDCPGSACPGYRVVFGIDYLASERESQARSLRSALAAHLRWYPQALVVVEEYDKVDCRMRGLLRQLLDAGGKKATGGSGTGSGGGGGAADPSLMRDRGQGRGGEAGREGKGLADRQGGRHRAGEDKGIGGDDDAGIPPASQAIVILESNTGCAPLFLFLFTGPPACLSTFFAALRWLAP